MKKWKCRVCGYIHVGENPPDKCPVCQASADEFFEVGPEGEELAAMVAGKPSVEQKTGGSILARFYDFVATQVYLNHLHPISVHFPNGVLPAAVVFVALAIFWDHAGLKDAAWYNLIFVVVTMPVVLFSGYVSWHKRYRGAMTRIFVVKIACAAVSSVAAVVLVVWRHSDPLVMDSASSAKWLFLLVSLVMLITAGVAGHLGGKLVFGDRS